jgi:pimeloyl-ACP methyl ester carboxylesterase
MTLLHHTVEGAGPTVVLLHAGVADSRMWAAQRPALATGHTVVTCDLRGYGETPRVVMLLRSAFSAVPLTRPRASAAARRPRYGRRPVNRGVTQNARPGQRAITYSLASGTAPASLRAAISVAPASVYVGGSELGWTRSRSLCGAEPMDSSG